MGYAGHSDRVRIFDFLGKDPGATVDRRLHPLSLPIGGGKGRDGDVKSPLLIPGTKGSGCKQRIAFAGEGVGEGRKTRKQKLEGRNGGWAQIERIGGGSLRLPGL